MQSVKKRGRKLRFIKVDPIVRINFTLYGEDAALFNLAARNMRLAQVPETATNSGCARIMLRDWCLNAGKEDRKDEPEKSIQKAA